jgi:WD40 repeat protein
MNVIVTVSHSPLCSVVVWDIVSMVQLYKVQPKVASDLYGLEVLNGPDGKVYVVAASRDGDIPIYELKQDGSLRHITTRKVEPRGLISLCAPRTRPDFASPILAVGTSDGKLHLVDTATWEFLDTLNGHKGAIRAMSCYGQDYLVTASHDKTARVWNLSTSALTHLSCRFLLTINSLMRMFILRGVRCCPNRV